MVGRSPIPSRSKVLPPNMDSANHDDNLTLGLAVDHINSNRSSTSEGINETNETGENHNHSPLPDSHERISFPTPLPPNNGSVEKPYYSKKPHKKSRAGCINCKRRKVKCNEDRPACQACTLRRENCVYPAPPRKKVATSPGTGDAPARTPSQNAASSTSRTDRNPFQLVVSEPLFRPAQVNDAVDMRMLWFWTVETYSSFSVESRRAPAFDHALKIKLVEHAFCSPFLMDLVMALSASHSLTLKQEVSPQRALSYRTRAFAGLRNAIDAPNPDDHPALLACSLLVAALSSQTFREADHKPLYIIDWMQVWKGISLVMSIVTPKAIRESGLAVMFYRPPVFLEKAAQHIPNNLLFMVASISPGDADHGHQQTYYEALCYLGTLYQELNRGFGPVLDLRIITLLTFMTEDFIWLSQNRRPRALIILAHYLCFVKLNHTIWWMQGISDPELDHIIQAVNSDWEHLMRVPRKVRTATDMFEIAKIVTENRTWAPEEDDLYEQHACGSAIYDFTLLNQPVGEYSLYSEEERNQPPSNTLLDALKQTGSILPLRPARDATLAKEAADASPNTQSSAPASVPSLSPGSSVPECEPDADEKWDLIKEIQRQILGQNSAGAPSTEGSPSRTWGTTESSCWVTGSSPTDRLHPF